MKLLRRGTKENKKASKKEKNQNPKRSVQITDEETIFTHVLDVNNLSQSFSTSPVISKKKKRRNKKKSRRCHGSDASSVGSNTSLTSLDHRIIETEQRVQSAIRKLASESFEYGDDGTSRMDEYNRDKPRVKLMTSHGLLVFDGLGESKHLENGIKLGTLMGVSAISFFSSCVFIVFYSGRY